ncbi:MAG TPA: class I SAM-dependent methyltransferase [Candidatus Eisenbacteria bacterium]|nr:class I SAM-dependent methyltransferase [Candidatus Eisenbacteria bacterium]
MAYTSAYLDPALYDVIYSTASAKPGRAVLEDVPFYVDLAKRQGNPVLEVACGTGRVLLPTQEAGVEIHGVDLEAGMLERLRHKASARGITPRVFQGDMRDFTLPSRYRLATIPFRAFLHMESTEDQIRALRCIREHLEPGGMLALNVFYPSVDFMAAHDGVRALTVETTHPDTGLPVQVYDTSRYQRAEQRVTVDREVLLTAADGSRKTIQYGFTLRWIYRFEMELLLRAAGFPRFEFLGGFDGRPLTSDREEMVIMAWKD